MSAICSKKIDGDDLEQLTIARKFPAGTMKVKDDQQDSLLKFKCRVKGNNTILSGYDWQRFVKDNGVKVGHTVAICKNDSWGSSEAEYKIEVWKQNN